jgi:hypothetical protein
MADQKLSDEQVWNRLHAASEALGREGGATTAGNTALEAARRSLILLQMGVLKSSEDAKDRAELARGPQPDPQ